MEETKNRKMKKAKKKHKKKSKRKTSSSDSESRSEELEWVEAPQPTPVFQTPRDEWMSAETFVPTLSKEEIRTKIRKDKGRSCEHSQSLSAIDKPGQHERELNPYWKDNGQGVPMDNNENAVYSSVKLPVSSVGDGGLSWLRKAYRRVQEQAEEEGRTMEEVAVERWGSLEKLEVLLAEAEKRNRNLSSFDAKESVSRNRIREDYLGRHRLGYNRSSKDEAGSRGKDCSRIKKPVNFRNKVSETGPRESRNIEGAHNFKKMDIKSMFRKPEESFTEFQPTDRSKSSVNRPAWMKKEYAKDFPSQIDKPEFSDKEKAERKSENIDQKVEESFEVTSKLEQENSPVLTDNEMNSLAAKILKAEIIGNDVLALQLKDQLESAKEARKTVTLKLCPSLSENKEQEEILLTKTDYRGISRPLYAPQQFESHSSGKKKMQKEMHDTKNKRTKYLPDDSKYSLKEMFAREKLTTAEDQIEMYVDIAKECKESTNPDYDLDDISGKVIKKMGQYRQEEKDIGKAIREHKRLSAALERCQFCLDGPHMKKHLMITVINKTYLCLPPYQSLTDGHCLIVPKSHVPSITLLDEDDWNEIQALKRCIMKMFEDMEQSVVFIETSMHLRDCPHAVIEGIPMPKETGELAPLYFKKAIQESESEWAHNQKLVDLFKKDIRHSVPKGLPYFCVEFGLNGGFAHVIEDEKRFPKSFGKEVIGGMMDLESPLLRKEKRDGFKEQAKKVLKFSQLWKSYEHHIKSYL